MHHVIEFPYNRSNVIFSPSYFQIDHDNARKNKFQTPSRQIIKCRRLSCRSKQRLSEPVFRVLAQSEECK